MKARTIATAALLGFVGVSVVYLVIQESPPKPANPTGSGQESVAAPESRTSGDVAPTSGERNEQAGGKLIAYYFHRTQRCRTCLAIEADAEEALKDACPEALATGRLEWRTVNVEEPANERFVKDYQLTESSLVLVYTEDGAQEEWRKLERVWDLVGDELEFKAYVEAEASVFLERGS